MLALGLLLSLGPAQAQDLVPTFTGEHTWKLEAYLQEVGVPESQNLKPAAAEAWGGKLTCKPIATRVESCTWADNKVYWGWLAPGATELELHPIDAPITVEVTYSPTGRVQSWNTKGDRTTYLQNLATAYGARVASGWRMESPDFRRRLGQELEQRSTTYLLAALDVELPKKGQDNGLPWKYGALPYTMRRGQGAMGGNAVEVARMAADQQTIADGIRVSLKGSGTVTFQAGGSGSSDAAQDDGTASGTTTGQLLLPVTASADQSFTTKMIGNVLIGKVDGRVVASDMWTTTGSTLPVYGYKTLAYRATKWSDDQKVEPGPVPKIPWK